MITCTKKFGPFPFAHRQHNHEGHCALIHGHNFYFEITFACRELDPNGFVIDFGRMGFLKAWLQETFDHTLLLNETDPLLTELIHALREAADIRIVPNGSAEGLAAYILRQVNGKFFTAAAGKMILAADLPDEEQRIRAIERAVQAIGVVVWEDDKNFATITTSFGPGTK